MALSARALKAFLGRNSDDVSLSLLTFTHAKLDTPIRVVLNTKDIVSNGNTFIAYPFEVKYPSDNEGVPEADLRIANVDTSIGDSLNGLIDAMGVKLESVLEATPDVVDSVWDHFELINVNTNAMVVTGKMVVRSRVTEPWPNKMVNENNFKAIFTAMG